MTVELVIARIVIFVGFGALIGMLFGFFGMGGSFLVTPALLVSGYPVQVAVGSGLAFVFGTSLIGALRHRDYGQIEYRLAALMIVGMTPGVEVGKRAVFFLEELGAADLVVSLAYVGLLGLGGIFTLCDARSNAPAKPLPDRAEEFRLPPTVQLTGGHTVSVWLILAIGGVTGILSGFLGVGGGFLLLPAMVYGLGVPVTVAVGTDILQITVSSAYGAFVYADAGAVALPAVGPLLAGSAFGTRIGAALTTVVDANDVMGGFAVLLIAGSLSVAMKELGRHLGLESLHVASVVLVFGTPVLVCSLIVFVGVCRLRHELAVESSAA